MKNKKDKVRKLQYCIDAILFTEVLDVLPQHITIERLNFEIGHPWGKLRQEPPARLKALGVHYIRIPGTRREVAGTFRHLTRGQMRKRMEEICREIGEPLSQARVASLHIEVNGTLAYFRRVKKEIRPDTTDQRKKLTVLGMETYNGNGVHELIKSMGLSKYVCDFEVTETTRVMCRKA